MRKHEGHDKYRQRIKGLTKIAVTAHIEARLEAEKQAWLEIEEMQAKWITFGRLKTFSTKETFRKALDKLKSQAQRSSGNKDCEETSTTPTTHTPTPTPEDNL